MRPRKQTLFISYAALLFIITLLPVISLLFSGGAENTDNRTLSEKPALLTEDGLNTEYGEQCDTYITEHIGFRGKVIALYNMFQYYIFHTSAVPKVTAGRDGWLFYTEAVDGIRGKDRSTERTLYRAEKTAELIDEYIRGRGGIFILAIAPNKASVYPGKLRRGTYISPETDLSRLRERLSDREYYLDLYGLFREELNAEKTQYYYKYDSHWNALGALEVYRAAQRNISGRLDSYAYNNYDGVETQRTAHTGDLAKMLLPGNAPAEYEDAPVLPRQYISARPITDPLARRIETFCDIEAPSIEAPSIEASSLLMLRDSFGSALIDPFSDNFSHVLYSTVLPYDICQAEEEAAGEGYDIVMIEVAERNLLNIISGAPELPAPPREKPGSVSERDITVRCSVEQRGGGVLISGSLGGDIPTGAEDNIYIEIVTGSTAGFYEAVPASRSDPRDDGAFMALLPEGYTGAEDMYIHIGNGGHTERCRLLADM